jgi:hypothetical protein
MHGEDDQIVPVKRPRSTVEQEVHGKVGKAKSRFSP